MAPNFNENMADFRYNGNWADTGKKRDRERNWPPPNGNMENE